MDIKFAAREYLNHGTHGVTFCWSLFSESNTEHFTSEEQRDHGEDGMFNFSFRLSKKIKKMIQNI